MALIVTRNSKTYTDIDLDFSAHPVTGDIVKKTNAEAIKRSVRNLIFTNKFERPFQHHIGSNIRRSLFELATPLLYTTMEMDIRNTITNFEPRVTLINVIVDILPDNHTLAAFIEFRINNSNEKVSLTIMLERLR